MVSEQTYPKTLNPVVLVVLLTDGLCIVCRNRTVRVRILFEAAQKSRTFLNNVLCELITDDGAC